MRLMLYLTAQADTAYLTNYHRKLSGRVWRALKDTPVEERHGSGEPSGFCMSNPFPFGDMKQGDERKVIVSSVDEETLSYVAKDVKRDPEFNLGEMEFVVDDMSAFDVDVGEPGTSGTMETATGVVVRLYEDAREEYGIENGHRDTPTYWRPEHTTEPFVDAVTGNLQRKHDRFVGDHLPGPAEVEGDLFNGYEMIKTYGLPVTVTEGVEMDMVLSKWRLSYEVRDNHHRRHLNLALDAGIGGRNSLGLGFVNITDKNEPRRQNAAT